MNRRLYRSRTDTILGGVASRPGRPTSTPIRPSSASPGPSSCRSPAGSRSSPTSSRWIVIPEEPLDVREWQPRRRTSEVSARHAGRGPHRLRSRSARSPAQREIKHGCRAVGGPGGSSSSARGFCSMQFMPDINWSLVWPLAIVAIGVLIVRGCAPGEADRWVNRSRERPPSGTRSRWRRSHQSRPRTPKQARAERREQADQHLGAAQRQELRAVTLRRIGELEAEVPRRQGACRVDVPVRHRQRRAEREDEHADHDDQDEVADAPGRATRAAAGARRRSRPPRSSRRSPRSGSGTRTWRARSGSTGTNWKAKAATIRTSAIERRVQARTRAHGQRRDAGPEQDRVPAVVDDREHARCRTSRRGTRSA